MIELNENQIQRLFMLFEFNENEGITKATIESERGGWLEIHYKGINDKSKGCHRIYLAKHSQEDLDKVDFILNGIKLERNPS